MYFCINPRRIRGFIQDLDLQSDGLCFVNGSDVVESVYIYISEYSNFLKEPRPKISIAYSK